MSPPPPFPGDRGRRGRGGRLPEDPADRRLAAGGDLRQGGPGDACPQGAAEPGMDRAGGEVHDPTGARPGAPDVSGTRGQGRLSLGSYLELIARVTSHIPDKGQVMVRYYGLYANARIHGASEADVRGGEAPAVPCFYRGRPDGGRGERGILLSVL